jgi:hypothetical protein
MTDAHVLIDSGQQDVGYTSVFARCEDVSLCSLSEEQKRLLIESSFYKEITRTIPLLKRYKQA